MKEEPNHDRKCTAYRTRGFTRLFIWAYGRAEISGAVQAHCFSPVRDRAPLVARNLFGNLFAAIYWIQRKFFLKDTGRKLRHIDNQASGGHTSMPLPNGDWNAR